MRIVKKYANRKLYDTSDKKYVVMDTLAKLIKDGEEVTVIDKQTGDDITSAVVSQILARENKDHEQRVSSGVLVQLIRRSGETVKDYSENVKKWIGKSIDKRIDEVLGKMNLATRGQIQKLDGRIDELLDKVEYLKRLQDMKTSIPTTKSQDEAELPPTGSGR